MSVPDQSESGARNRILIITEDAIGTRMAGPAIRAVNMAKVLSAENDVRVLSTSAATDLASWAGAVPVEKVEPGDREGMSSHETWADILVVQGYVFLHFPQLRTSSKILVVDLYDPVHLEHLEMQRHAPIEEWNKHILDAVTVLNHQLVLGDYFLCASERQRDFWLGQLAALGRINAFTYSDDGRLQSLISVAPFGIPAQSPVPTGPGLRGIMPGIGETDKVILWGGGIYNWFDPLTLVRAIADLSRRRSNVRLVFLGGQHPNPNVPEMAAAVQARELAVELGVLNIHVFFNEGWVPYESRQNYLLDADAGVSTHFDHLETRFSFRTRILDYLWAGLPIVATDGDPLADLIREHRLGEVVPEKDAEKLSQGIERVLFDERAVKEYRANIVSVRDRLTWEQSLSGLIDFCRHASKASDRPGRDLAIERHNELIAELHDAGSGSGKPHLVRDMRRVLYHLRNGGPAAVIAKYQARKRMPT